MPTEAPAVSYLFISTIPPTVKSISFTLLCTAIRSSLAAASKLGSLPNQRLRSYALSLMATHFKACVRKMGWCQEFGLYVCTLKDCLCGWDLGNLTHMEKEQRKYEIHWSLISGNFKNPNISRLFTFWKIYVCTSSRTSFYIESFKVLE